MKWHDQPRILLEMYLLKMAEPYYNIKELIQKIDELSKNVPKSAMNFQPVNNTKQSAPEEDYSFKEEEHPQFEEEVITMADSIDYDLIGLWNEAVTDVVNKHPMTAQPLKTKNVKEINKNTIQVALPDEVSYGMVKDYCEVVQKLMTRKAGREITVKMIIEKNGNANSVTKEDIVINNDVEENKEMFVIKEDFKETAKTAVPKNIASIAKKFGARSIKKQNVQQQSSVTLKENGMDGDSSDNE
jgi:DNA polymerase-3 subunit gamma/tau